MKTKEEILAKHHGESLQAIIYESEYDTWVSKSLEAMQEYADQLIPKWISVEERLPELTESFWGYNDDNVLEEMIPNFQIVVLAYHPDIGIYKAKRNKMGWTEISSVSSRGITPTHWVPLPNAPQNGQ